MRGRRKRTCVVRGCCCSLNRRKCGRAPGACLERSLFSGNRPTLKYTTASQHNQLPAIAVWPGNSQKKQLWIFFLTPPKKVKTCRSRARNRANRANLLIHLWYRRLCRPYRQSMWSAGPACWTRPTGPPPQRCGNGCTRHRTEPLRVHDPFRIVCADTQEKFFY